MLTNKSGFFEKLDYTSRHTPKCPFCDYEIDIEGSELQVLYKEGEHEICCPGCEKNIVVRTDIITLFSTEEQPDL